MEMIQNGIAEGLRETIRGDHCEQGVPVIGGEQSAKEVNAINVPDHLDIAAQEPEELIRIDIRIPENISQFGSYVSDQFIQILSLIAHHSIRKELHNREGVQEYDYSRRFILLRAGPLFIRVLLSNLLAK